MALFIFFALVTFSHAIFLLKAKKSLWELHFALNSILWSALLTWLSFAQFQDTDLIFSEPIKWAGLLIAVAGVFLVFRVATVLNLEELMGRRFFYPSESKKIDGGIFKYLNNPMYDGFILILVGLGFYLGLSFDFYLAGASFILLNVFLASVENYKFSLNPF